jgi:acetolactate synthase-1/3 small subunit
MSPVISRSLIAYVEDRPGVLARVVSLLRRRGYSIDSLTVGPTERTAISQVTLVVRIDEDGARRLIANLYKLVEVVDVEDVTLSPAVVRELALIRLRSNAEAKAAMKALCEACSARILEETARSFTVEVTGTRAEVDAAVEALRNRGVLRLVRTGAVAVSLQAEERESAPGERNSGGGSRSPAEPEPERLVGGVR